MNKRFPQLLGIVFFLSVFAFESQPAHALLQSATRQPKSRALLVGIDHYKHAPAVKPTRGAEADARETAQFIQSKYGFRSEDIHLLLGAEATAARIKQELQDWLITGTKPGDRIFFLYAGHGSQTKDLTGDEADGLDEVLAPYDVVWQGDGFANAILDDELDELIRQLPGRQAVFVFDSCNSGTITRGPLGANTKAESDGDARYLPSPAEAKSLGIGPGTRNIGQKMADYAVSDDRILTPKSGAPVSAQARQTQDRDLKLVDVNGQGPTAGHVIISAAQSHQSAYSMNANGQQRGALSWVFADAQRTQPLSLRELRQTIIQQIEDLQERGRLRGKQRPVIEAAAALESKPLFAADFSLPELIFANPQSKLRVALRSLEGKRTYQIGDQVSYEVTTNAPGWLYVLVFSQQGIATCIFPNAKEGDSQRSPGAFRLPSRGSFYAQEPIGKDVVVALLSAVPLRFGDKEDMTWQEVFDRLRSKKLAGYVKTRGVGTTNPSPVSGAASLEEADWQAVSLVIETIP